MGANYRAVCEQIASEFISKINVVLEEADESAFWFELLIESEIVPAPKLESLLNEANELICIFSASLRTAKRAVRR